MDQKWIPALLILMFYHELCSGSEQVVRPRANEPVDIQCQVEAGPLVVWFRMLDNSGMEFIASYTNSFKKSSNPKFSQFFSDRKIDNKLLTLKSFKPGVDDGVYSCAAFKGNELKFGKVTRLTQEKIKAPTKAPATTVSKQSVVVTSTPCVCKNKAGPPWGSDSMSCAPLILGSLAGGCGLLLLLLIVTILYCNRIRTRRCPHHYKRKLRVAPEKQMMTHRHV